jgi:hypothetical protein
MQCAHIKKRADAGEYSSPKRRRLFCDFTKLDHYILKSVFSVKKRLKKAP